jgi:hypothetical protein
MDQRRDRLLRGVVDQAQPVLTACGFGLADRGTHPEAHWVEYSSVGPPTAFHTRVMLTHVLENHTLGASVRWYRGAAPRSAARTAQAWSYQPGSDRLPNDDLLASAVAAWIQAAVASGPPRADAERNGRALTSS